MTEHIEVKGSVTPLAQFHEWVGAVLHSFARAEQALGQLAIELDLSIEKGPLSPLNEVRRRLKALGRRGYLQLENRIDAWLAQRPLRHLLAHGTLSVLFDENGEAIAITRLLPRNKDDVTGERVWSESRRQELHRQAANDARSICDQVKNLIENKAILKALREA